MASNSEVVRDASESWMSGTGHIAAIFAPDMTWEIVGHSVASARFAGAPRSSRTGSSPPSPSASIRLGGCPTQRMPVTAALPRKLVSV